MQAVAKHFQANLITVDSFVLEFGASSPAIQKQRDTLLVPLLRGITDFMDGEEEEEEEELLDDNQKASGNVVQQHTTKFKKGNTGTCRLS